MKLKQGYKTLSILSILLGLTLFLSVQNSVVGATIVKNEISTNSMILWSSFFLASGTLLYFLQKIDKK